jgi:hypothetical protein
LPFRSYNITQWFANDFCMSHSSHLQVWIRDIDLVLSPIWHACPHSAGPLLTLIGGGTYFTMTLSGERGLGSGRLSGC